MQLSSWYLFYVSPRPLVNNIETLLITATLNLWPTRYNDKVTYPAVILAALSVAIRPTLVLFWVFLGVHYLIKCPERRFSSIIKAFVIGLPTLVLTTLLDSYMYGKFTFVFQNFLKFNMAGSEVYGAHPWHWYLSQGVPAILGTHSIFIAVAFIKERDYPRQFLGVVLATLFFFSTISHKEFRFVQHLMPICMVWAGLGLHWISRHIERSSLYTIIMLNALVNIIVAFYIGFFHQRGTISVVHDLSSSVKSGDSVVFLTPCHATPYHSHIHNAEVDLRFLDCSPDLSGLESYEHEEKQFYRDPQSWWKKFSGEKKRVAKSTEYVVAFEENLPHLHKLLKDSGYKVDRKYFFAHLLVDDKLTSHLLLYKKTWGT
ncbi:GPI mannosyltransferase 3-like [Bolinopsis microptera]|uniref:GPI mannosyltransferase 3-like n=1 Tax=Bolinopsis microptera TaxID=2820187 RepID=UPI00307A75C0